MSFKVAQLFGSRNVSQLTHSRRAPLVALALALLAGGCGRETRSREARLDQVSDELRIQQKQLQTLISQSTNLEWRLQKLESASADVGPIMSGIQLDFAKLYYAGEARNWDLARFERDEVVEGLTTVAALRPQENGVNLAGIVQAFTNGPLASLQNAIGVYDRPMFRKAYSDSIMMCNACHTSTGRPFIVIQIPTNPPVFNQRWEPANLFGTNNAKPHEK